MVIFSSASNAEKHTISYKSNNIISSSGNFRISSGTVVKQI